MRWVYLDPYFRTVLDLRYRRYSDACKMCAQSKRCLISYLILRVKNSFYLDDRKKMRMDRYRPIEASTGPSGSICTHWLLRWERYYRL